MSEDTVPGTGTGTSRPALDAFDAHRRQCAQCHGEYSVNKMCAGGKRLFDEFWDEEMKEQE